MSSSTKKPRKPRKKKNEIQVNLEVTLTVIPTPAPAVVYQPDTTRYAGLSPNKLPKKWFPFYVVYKYSWNMSTYVVGFDSDVSADEFQNDLLARGGISRCEIFGHYPVDLLKEGDAA